MKRYPWNNKCHIMFFVNGISDVIILSFFHEIVVEFTILIHNSYLIAGLELLWWLHWKYDYTYPRCNQCSFGIRVS